MDYWKALIDERNEINRRVNLLIARKIEIEKELWSYRNDQPKAYKAKEPSILESFAGIVMLIYGVFITIVLVMTLMTRGLILW